MNKIYCVVWKFNATAERTLAAFSDEGAAGRYRDHIDAELERVTKQRETVVVRPVPLDPEVFVP